MVMRLREILTLVVKLSFSWFLYCNYCNQVKQCIKCIKYPMHEIKYLMIALILPFHCQDECRSAFNM